MKQKEDIFFRPLLGSALVVLSGFNLLTYWCPRGWLLHVVLSVFTGLTMWHVCYQRALTCRITSARGYAYIGIIPGAALYFMASVIKYAVEKFF